MIFRKEFLLYSYISCMELNYKTESLLLELAISIGVNTGSEMFTLTMPLFIEKLDCNGALVLSCNGHEVKALSVHGLEKAEQEWLIKKVSVSHAGLSLKEPFCIISSDSSDFHVFILAGFGILVLRFRKSPDPVFIQKLLPVINQLAKACDISRKLESLNPGSDNSCQADTQSTDKTDLTYESNNNDSESYAENKTIKAEEKLNLLLTLQNLLTHLATEFINVPVEKSKEAIGRLLSVIGEGNEIDRVYVFEYDFTKNTMSNTHEWCANEISHESSSLQQIPNEFLPALVEAHKKGEMFTIQDVSQLNPNEDVFKIKGFGEIKTLITMPLTLNGECIGFVGFDSIRKMKQWNSDEIIFLQILADLLCNVEDRKRKAEALQNREASLKAIFNNVPFQMWLKDVDSKYIAVNKPFMDYFSITGENEIVGKDAIGIWNTEVGRHFIEQDKQVMQSLEISSVEELVDFKHKSAWFEIFRAPIIGQNGQLL